MVIEIEPSRDLLEKILMRIHREERVLVFKKIFIFSLTSIASIVGLVPTFGMVSTDLSKSGFLNFLSLGFSDFSAIAAYWQSFVLILLETMPVISLAIFLALVLVSLESIRSLSKNVKIIINNNHLAIS